MLFFFTLICGVFGCETNHDRRAALDNFANNRICSGADD